MVLESGPTGPRHAPPRAPAVAILGTTRPTPYGLRVAGLLGDGLAESGIAVVTLVEPGVAAAAHRELFAGGGAPGGRPRSAHVGVAAQPGETSPGAAPLARALRARGTVLTVRTAPAGRRHGGARAVARVLASLADVAVVVESGSRGRSVDIAEVLSDAGVTVMGVPGSVLSPASSGPNLLISEGCPPARDVADVIAAVALGGAGAYARRGGARSSGSPER